MEQTKPQNQTNHYNTNNELPRLILKRSKGTSDFITEEIYLEAQGWDISEAQAGIEYLIDKLNGLKWK